MQGVVGAKEGAEGPAERDKVGSQLSAQITTPGPWEPAGRVLEARNHRDCTEPEPASSPS